MGDDPIYTEILSYRAVKRHESVMKELLLFHHNWGWSGGAMVLGKLPVPGCPTHFDNSKARAYCACNRCGCFFFFVFFYLRGGGFFLLTIFSILFLSL